jgi:hypothetical protein
MVVVVVVVVVMTKRMNDVLTSSFDSLCVQTNKRITGWVEPGLGALFTLRESYYPGELQ